MKFDMTKDYSKHIDRFMSKDTEGSNGYDFDAALYQLKRDDVNLVNAQDHSFVKGMPYPEHFAESLRAQNQMLKDK